MQLVIKERLSLIKDILTYNIKLTSEYRLDSQLLKDSNTVFFII